MGQGRGRLDAAAAWRQIAAHVASTSAAPLSASAEARICVTNEGAVRNVLLGCESLLHNETMIYDGAWVSTDRQSVAAQAAHLTAAGAENVFREVASGIKIDRARSARVVAQLHAGDVLPVTRFSRRVCSPRDLLNTLATNSGH